jgi:hypothetical protein
MTVTMSGLTPSRTRSLAKGVNTFVKKARAYRLSMVLPA